MIDCAPVQWRFIHFHGQKTSRQSRYRSIYKDSYHKRTKIFRLISLILFFAPDVHLRELERVWTDELIIEDIWCQKLVSEWVELVLYVSYSVPFSVFLKFKKSITLTLQHRQSTVLLAANVAFLAIPGVIVVPSEGWIKPSPAQIASSMSLVFSIGGIIAGLLLIRRIRAIGTQDRGTAVRRSFLTLRVQADWLSVRLPS